MLEIKPRGEHFRHAGELQSNYDGFDPRSSEFDERQVLIDLRDCEFVRPPAALWALTFLALASKRGADCELLVPLNFGVASYLAGLGLYAELKKFGIRVDDRDLGANAGENVVLPITSFFTTSDATEVNNRVFESLQNNERGGADLISTVTELFGELSFNAVQHSESEVGAFACIQFFRFSTGTTFTCAVADGGIGVFESLRKNPTHRSRINYDWDALELAVRERVSGTDDPHRGIGLYGVSEDVRQPGRTLRLHSGIGSLEINEELEMSARRTRLFPGTLAYLSIPV